MSLVHFRGLLMNFKPLLSLRRVSVLLNFSLPINIRNCHSLFFPPLHLFTDLEERPRNMKEDIDKHITRGLFCGPHFPASHEYTGKYLKNHSFIKVDVVPLEDVPKVIADYHVCIVKMMRLDSDLISRAVQMQLIMQYGVGLEGVDIDAATKHGIKVARIPSDVTGNSASCAEMAIYLMLGLLRKQNEIQIAVQQKMLGYPTGETLLGKTIFILGFGNIGMDLALPLRPFGVKVIATKWSWDSYAPQTSKSNRYDVNDLVDVKGWCRQQEFHIFDEKGHLGGLGIDVAWTEPFNPEDPILKFKNVIITPHVAGVTEHSYRSIAKVVGAVVLQLHAGLL